MSGGLRKRENCVVFYINDIDTDSNIIYHIICICIIIYMGVFKNRGTRKWMVSNGKPY